MTPCTTWTRPRAPAVSACPSWGLDDVRPVLEVGNKIFVSMALEAAHTKILGSYLMMIPFLGRSFQLPKGTLPRVTPAFLLHADRHASREVPELGAVYRKDLCRDGTLSRLSFPALPGRGQRNERRPLEDRAQRNLLAVRHDSKP